nr:MAG TPA: hypothetical protein [Bacteriophage sp.]
MTAPNAPTRWNVRALAGYRQSRQIHTAMSFQPQDKAAGKKNIALRREFPPSKFVLGSYSLHPARRFVKRFFAARFLCGAGRYKKNT